MASLQNSGLEGRERTAPRCKPPSMKESGVCWPLRGILDTTFVRSQLGNPIDYSKPKPGRKAQIALANTLLSPKRETPDK